jgi:hypothetical protein
MNTLKRIKIVLLEEKERIENCIVQDRNMFYHFQTFLTRDYAKITYTNTYHIYVISDETDGSFCRINAGDWVLLPNNTIKQMSHSDILDYLNSGSTATKKIITSTNLTLKLPIPNQNFTDNYCISKNKGSKIENALVECDEIKLSDGSDFWFEPKINYKDNSIAIIEEKNNWTREEYLTDLQYYMEYCQRNGYVTPMDWLSKYKHY